MSLLGRLLGLDEEPRTRPARPDPPMRRVLAALDGLGYAPPETLAPEAARRQPTLADAEREILGGPRPDLGVAARDLFVPGAAGPLPARLYRPRELALDGGRAPPVVLCLHGGGWVLGGLDDADAAARGVARLAGCMVLSCAYRLAPEHRFPAAHEDAWAAWTWLAGHAGELGGDPGRVALMGEDAGATLACATAVRARDAGGPLPCHLALVSPIAGADLESPSALRNAHATPFGRATAAWCLAQAFDAPEQREDRRVNLLEADLIGLPSATVVCAEIDPLLDDGERLADCLQQAGVDVRQKTFHGSTRGFFGLAAVLPDAVVAQQFVADDLKRAFAR